MKKKAMKKPRSKAKAKKSVNPFARSAKGKGSLKKGEY